MERREGAETDTRAAILLAVAALLAAGIGIRAAILSDSGADTWQTAVRDDVRRGARIVSDVRRLYGEDAAVAHQIAELQIRAEEAGKAAKEADGPAAGVVRAEAAARRQLAKTLASSSPVVDDPRKAPRLTASDVAERLAELRREAGAPARLDPDATEAEGSDKAKKGSLLTGTVLIVALAFLCGALAAGFQGLAGRLLPAGYAFAGAGFLAAVLVEVLA